MKITGFKKTGLALATAITVAVSITGVFAQDTATPPPVTLSTTTPALSSAASQVLQLSQAKISDGTIITYVQNSGTVYGLDASQIVYLKQQGVSENVINAMLNQRTALAATAMPPSPPDNSAPSAPIPPPAPTTDIAQPATPAPSVVVVPDSQTYYYNNWAYPYYYPYYGYYGPTVYWGWGGGWRGGYYGGWHGGYGGGFHGGGGGGFHGGGGGGFHGGGGGGGHH